MKLTGERKPPPSGVRVGTVADVTAIKKERPLPKPTAPTKPWRDKVAGSRSKLATTLRNADQLSQRIVLLLGSAAVALNTLFPPWVFVLNINNQWHAERFAGYHLITNSNQPQDVTALGEMFHTHANILAYTSIRLDTQRLFAQLAGILFVTALCFFAVKAKGHSKVLSETTGVACPRPTCKGELIVKRSRRGKIFYGCAEYPECEMLLWDKPVANECPQCGAAFMLEKTTKEGTFRYCAADGCDYALGNLVGRELILKKSKGL